MLNMCDPLLPLMLLLARNKTFPPFVPPLVNQFRMLFLVPQQQQLKEEKSIELWVSKMALPI